MMALPHWFISIIKKLFPQRFFLAKLTKVPLLGKMIEKAFFEEDEIIFLPKDQTIEIQQASKTIAINQPIDQFEEFVVPSKIIEYFIEQANYHFIMDFCICRSANRCENYPIDLGCLFLGETVLKIDPTLGKLVSKEEALEHIKKCQEAGLVHLIGRNKLDTMWLDARPKEKLLTICNCCECCCLWKMIPYLSKPIQKNVRRIPGIQITVTENCVGCGKCTQGVCFVDAIQLKDGKAVISNDCRGCGRCVEICPHEAIKLSLTKEALKESKRLISRVVDVT